MRTSHLILLAFAPLWLPIVVALMWFCWVNFFAFGSLRVVNHSGEAVVGGDLETRSGVRRIGAIAAGESHLMLIRVGGEIPWSATLHLASGRTACPGADYYSGLSLVNDEVELRPEYFENLGARRGYTDSSGARPYRVLGPARAVFPTPRSQTSTTR